MTSKRTLQYLTCATCGPRTLFNGLGCLSCRGPHPVSPVTRPNHYSYYGQSEARAKARMKRAGQKGGTAGLKARADARIPESLQYDSDGQ